MKRIASLDLMRGFAILAMILSHAFVFGPFYPTQNPGTPSTGVLTPRTPLEMTPPYFFFVTGMSLAVSLYIRVKDRKQSLTRITRHVLIRNVVLILIGTLITPLLGMIFRQSFAVSDIPRRITRSFGEDVVAMIGWVNLLAFPLVFFLSWKTLLALTTATSVLVSIILSMNLYPIPDLSIALLLTGDFAALKTLPIVFLGGAIGKLLLERKKNMAKWAGISGVITFIAFLVTVEFLGGGIAYGGGRKLYYFAVPMTVGFSLMSLSLFQFLENRGFKLMPVTIIGRLALPVFIVHGIVLGFMENALPRVSSSMMGLVYSLSITAIIWIAAYFFSRWRWGNIADQYE